MVRVGALGEVLHMTSDDRVRHALAALAEADGGRHAPSHLDAVLLDAFDRSVRDQQMVRNSAVGRPVRLLALAATLLLTTSGVLYVRERGRRTPTPPADRPAILAARDEMLPPAASPEPLVALHDDRVRRLASRARTPAPRPDGIRDSDTAAAASEAFDGAIRVVRMRLTRATLPLLGIPIIDPNAEGTVEIELLVGEDGLAKSIRAVR
jgi:hypothetical protein